MNDATPRATPLLVRPSLYVLTFVALLFSALLLSGSLSETRHVPGCGDPGISGCDRILATRWAYWFALPVSALAVLHYAAMLAALPMTHPTRPLGARRSAWFALMTMSAAGLGVAVWFVVVQAAVLDQWCVYCLAAHGCAAALAALLWWSAHHQEGRFRPRAVLLCLLAAAVLCGMLIAGQGSTPPPAFQTQHADPGIDFDTGPGPDRRMSAYGGRIRFEPHSMPILGAPDAPIVILTLYDYTCGHCRALHAMLDEVRQSSADRLAIVAVQVPMNASCNPAVAHTPPSALDACELARLALAVWHADPARFAEMDAWLMKGDTPPTTLEARAHAAAMLGQETLDAALADPAVEQRLNRNLGLYFSLAHRAVPMLVARASLLLGAPPTYRQLLDFLHEALPELAEVPVQSD